jgi:hypothetical protein
MNRILVDRSQLIPLLQKAIDKARGGIIEKYISKSGSHLSQIFSYNLRTTFNGTGETFWLKL